MVVDGDRWWHLSPYYTYGLQIHPWCKPLEFQCICSNILDFMKALGALFMHCKKLFENDLKMMNATCNTTLKLGCHLTDIMVGSGWA